MLIDQKNLSMKHLNMLCHVHLNLFISIRATQRQQHIFINIRFIEPEKFGAYFDNLWKMSLIKTVVDEPTAQKNHHEDVKNDHEP